MNIYHILKEHVESRPQECALIDAQYDQRWCYERLDSASAAISAQLHKAGLQSGDHVLLLIPMSISLYATLMACLRLGLVVVLIDPRAGLRHIKHCCKVVPPRALIAVPQAHLLRLVSPALRAIKIRFSLGYRVPGTSVLSMQMASDMIINPVTELSEQSPALITFTSGSTAMPKAVVRSHGFLLSQYHALRTAMPLDAGSVDLSLFPVFVLSNLASGICSIIPDVNLRYPARIKGAHIARLLVRYNAHRLSAPPVVLKALAHHCNHTACTLPYTLKIYTGGGPVTPQLMDELSSLVPASQITAVYGSSEAEPIALCNADSMNKTMRQRSLHGGGLMAGSPVDGIQLAIIHDHDGKPIQPMNADEFSRICIDDGRTGEIIVTGAHVLGGYLNGYGDEIHKLKVDGTVWHRTGDAGHLDTNGLLWLEGRCSARIKDHAQPCYPLGAEVSALSIQGVKAAALIGIAGKRMLVLSCPYSMRTQIKRKVRAHPNLAAIDHIRFIRHMPLDRRHQSKIDYPRLYQKYARSVNAQMNLSLTPD